MKLIKCSHCGRPFYNDEKACPYCGHPSNLSATNFITRSISDPKSHKLMEDMLSGNYQQVHIPHITHVEVPPANEPKPIEVQPTAPVVEKDTTEEPAATETKKEEEKPQIQEPSEAIQERADNIAAATKQSQDIKKEDAEATEEPNSTDTEHLPRKRHGWIWIIVIILILAIAAAVYLKWDFVYGKITSLLGK